MAILKLSLLLYWLSLSLSACQNSSVIKMFKAENARTRISGPDRAAKRRRLVGSEIDVNKEGAAAAADPNNIYAGCAAKPVPGVSGDCICWEHAAQFYKCGTSRSCYEYFAERISTESDY